MFVRRRRDAPEAVLPTTLEGFNLTITQDDKLRQLSDPTLRFEYKVHKQPRLNELRREGINECLRQHVLERLLKLGLVEVKLSGEDDVIDGVEGGKVTVLVSKDLLVEKKDQKDQKKKQKNILLLFPDADSDLGIWSYRSLDGDSPTASIANGSMIFFVEKAVGEGYSVVVGNSGALMYMPEVGTTVTNWTWNARNKPWAVGGRDRKWDDSWNLVRGSEDPERHVGLVLERLLGEKGWCPEVKVGGEVEEEEGRARVYVVAAGEGAAGLVQYLDKAGNFDRWKPYLQAFAIGEPRYAFNSLNSGSLKDFLKDTARAYISTSSIFTPPPPQRQAGDGGSLRYEPPPQPTFENGEQITDDRFGCAIFSADTTFHECVVPTLGEQIWGYVRAVREWLEKEEGSPGGAKYVNPDAETRDRGVVVESVFVEPSDDEGEGQGPQFDGKPWGDGSVRGGGW
ncbi:hypothetical protein DFH27DRAFT_610747 [Peziza echinospora]|nr:hypothetical protein DFH27DRAFT_610747 [Peziza echinospora]